MDCGVGFQFFAQGLDAPCQPVGGLVVLDASVQDGVFLFVFLGELGGGGELRFGVVVLLEAMVRAPRA